VHVEMDFIEPLLKQARSVRDRTWAAVPPELRPYAPPVGGFAAGWLLTWSWMARRVNRERERRLAVQRSLAVASKERDDLSATVAAMERTGGGRTAGPIEAAYGRAVAELSIAASESAKTAAELSLLCSRPALMDHENGRGGGGGGGGGDRGFREGRTERQIDAPRSAPPTHRPSASAERFRLSPGSDRVGRRVGRIVNAAVPASSRRDGRPHRWPRRLVIWTFPDGSRSCSNL